MVASIGFRTQRYSLCLVVAVVSGSGVRIDVGSFLWIQFGAANHLNPFILSPTGTDADVVAV